MPERSDIDTSVLQRLIAIRQQQAVLRQYAERAAQAKPQVPAAVYEKVADDYARRAAALDQESGPLLAGAREACRVLQLLQDQATTAHGAATFAREELKLRHLAGEIDDRQLAERQREPAEAIERWGAELAALESLRAQCLEALGAEDSEAAARPAAAAPAPAPEATAGHVATLMTPTEAELTVLSAHAPEPAADGDTDQTTYLPSGVLIVEGLPGGPREYALGETTYIGRAEDSHVHIVHPTVSRRHAVVTAGNGGFRVRDLDSQNGTSVNGKPVTDQVLADGDQILIGSVPVLFRSPAPAVSR